jgi:hypothetical protein
MDPFRIVLGIIFMAIYFVPSIVAMAREHEQKIPILLLNIFLGWSVIGWVVALVWASLKQKDRRPGGLSVGILPAAGRCPHCLRPILIRDKRCGHCHTRLEAGTSA